MLDTCHVEAPGKLGQSSTGRASLRLADLQKRFENINRSAAGLLKSINENLFPALQHPCMCVILHLRQIKRTAGKIRFVLQNKQQGIEMHKAGVNIRDWAKK